MFTLRFCRPDKDYISYSVVSYKVKTASDGTVEVYMCRKLNGQDGVYECIGKHKSYEYDIAYITNLDGKTIDVIRQREVTHE